MLSDYATACTHTHTQLSIHVHTHGLAGMHEYVHAYDMHIVTMNCLVTHRIVAGGGHYKNYSVCTKCMREIERN